MSPLSLEKIDKYEYLTGENILTPNERYIIKQVNFSYPSLGKAFEKQIKKQVCAIKTLDFSNKKDE